MNIKKLTKKIAKRQALEDGRKQFNQMARPTTYIFVNNILMPVVDR